MTKTIEIEGKKYAKLWELQNSELIRIGRSQLGFHDLDPHHNGPFLILREIKPEPMPSIEPGYLVSFRDSAEKAGSWCAVINVFDHGYLAVWQSNWPDVSIRFRGNITAIKDREGKLIWSKE